MTLDELRRDFDYDPMTGEFTRRAKPAGSGRGCRPRASSAAKPKGDGYLRVFAFGKKRNAARLAWFYVFGEWPIGEIDHRDTDPGNTAFGNLRDVGRSANQQNQRRAQRSNKASGLLGVRRCGKGWIARIGVDNRDVYLGYRTTPEEAHRLYVDAKRQLHEGNTL